MGMIKFRGVNIFGNEWLYGNLVKIEENRYSILPEINDMPTCKCIADYDVNHNTIGRLTGLLDKNGKERGVVIRYRCERGRKCGERNSKIFIREARMMCFFFQAEDGIRDSDM